MATSTPPDESPDRDELLALDVLEELQMIDTDGCLLASLVSSFRLDSSDKLRELRESVRLGDGDATRRLAHSLGGAARTLGAVRLAAAAKRLEVASLSGDAAEKTALLLALDREVALGLEALTRFLSA